MRTRFIAWCLALGGICSPWASGDAATVIVDVDTQSPYTIDPLLFGSFFEEHRGDIRQGIYEQYFVNPSFEFWYDHPREDTKNDIVFTDVTAVSGIRYPWEPFDFSGAGRQLASTLGTLQRGSVPGALAWGASGRRNTGYARRGGLRGLAGRPAPPSGQ